MFSLVSAVHENSAKIRLMFCTKLRSKMLSANLNVGFFFSNISRIGMDRSCSFQEFS